MTADSPDSPDGDAVRRKRSRPDMVDTNGDTTIKPKPLTPPLTRRQSSSTPTLGVEMQIPSRPATPVATSTSFRSDATPQPAATLKPQQPPPLTSAPEDNNDDVWAAFEADVVHAKPAPPPPAVAGFADESGGAVISAPALSAAEIAARSHDEEHEKRRALVDVQREDEREDATRALEAEFEVMEELEARARRLRERREALRVQRSGELTAVSEKGSREGAGKENSGHGVGVVEEEDDEDDDEADDWDGFRFRA